MTVTIDEGKGRSAPVQNPVAVPWLADLMSDHVAGFGLAQKHRKVPRRPSLLHGIHRNKVGG